MLILSHSNQAVDVLMRETALFAEKREKFEEGKIMRYGMQRDVTSHLATLYRSASDGKTSRSC